MEWCRETHSTGSTTTYVACVKPPWYGNHWFRLYKSCHQKYSKRASGVTLSSPDLFPPKKIKLDGHCCIQNCTTSSGSRLYNLAENISCDTIESIYGPLSCANNDIQVCQSHYTKLNYVKCTLKSQKSLKSSQRKSCVNSWESFMGVCGTSMAKRTANHHSAIFAQASNATFLPHHIIPSST